MYVNSNGPLVAHYQRTMFPHRGRSLLLLREVWKGLENKNLFKIGRDVCKYGNCG